MRHQWNYEPPTPIGVRAEPAQPARQCRLRRRPRRGEGKARVILPGAPFELLQLGSYRVLGRRFCFETYSVCFPRTSSITDLAIRFNITNRSSLFFTTSPGTMNTEVSSSGTRTSQSQRSWHTSCSRQPVLTLNRSITACQVVCSPQRARPTPHQDWLCTQCGGEQCNGFNNLH